MLSCPIDPRYIRLSCGECLKCGGRSILNYPFDRDLFNSDDLVAAIIKYITATTGYRCERTNIHKYPDINVFSPNGSLICRIEAKYLEGQAFMTAKRYIGLYPRETIVVDEPKLVSYFSRKNEDRAQGRNIPIFVVWKVDRPCDDIGGIAIFQEIDTLQQIYIAKGDQRKFQRGAAFNDYCNGRELGVREKYHFSIRECEPIDQLPARIRSL